MVPKSVLDAAKAFLCWDALDGLSVQLVPVEGAAAYFYPPRGERSAVVVFYPRSSTDYTEPLMLLFHEAGHALQWRSLAQRGAAQQFQQCCDRDRGEERVRFEREAWALARGLFEAFAERQQLSAVMLEQFDRYAAACLAGYAGG